MPRKVLFDVDTGCDDATMLLTALAADELDVVGVSTVFGNTTLENTTRNTASILEYAGRGDVPVAEGCARPFNAVQTESSPDDIDDIHGETGLTADLPLVDPEDVELDGRHAAEFIVDMAEEHDELTVAAVGPQTNLALALALEPDLPEMVEDIYVMGGAVFRPGNVRPSAEFNFYEDPEAAARVIETGETKLVALDVTEQTHIPLGEIEALAEEGGPHAQFADLMNYYPEESIDRYGYEGPVVHDSIVAADLIDGVLGFEDHYVEVSLHDPLTRGQSVGDERGVLGEEPNTAVATEIDVERYQSLVLGRLRSLADGIAE
jgi:inosine-uridine nucleoside N-ribohydrolase